MKGHVSLSLTTHNDNEMTVFRYAPPLHDGGGPLFTMTVACRQPDPCYA